MWPIYLNTLQTKNEKNQSFHSNPFFLKFYLQKRNENHEISGKLQNTEKSNQNQNQNLIFILVMTTVISLFFNIFLIILNIMVCQKMCKNKKSSIKLVSYTINQL
jgi:hypothetical protein